MAVRREVTTFTTTDESSAGGRVVRADDWRREAAFVGLAIGLVLLAVALRLALIAGESGGPILRPYQRLADTLPQRTQTLYRTLNSATGDIIDLRNLDGVWPEADLLALEVVPPFDPALVPEDLRDIVWVGYDGGAWIDYLGFDRDATEPVSMILRMIDLHAGYHPHPHPGIDYDPDLLVTHQIWVYADEVEAYPGERLPEAGWQWVLSADDPLLVEQNAVMEAGP